MMQDSAALSHAAAPLSRVDDPERVRAGLQQGMRRIQEGRLDDAETVLRAVLMLAPADAEALKLFGAAKLQRGDWLAALNPARRSVLMRGLAYDRSNHGVALQCLRRLDAAVTAFRQAVAVKPDYHEALNNLGVVLRSQGKTDAALTSFQRALAVAPDYADALNNLSGALLERGSAAAAAEAHRQAQSQQLERQQFEAAEKHFNAGYMLGERKAWQDAAAAFRRAIALRPEVVDAYDALGNVSRNADRCEEALRAHRRAGRLAPHRLHHVHNQARALMGLGRSADAERLMRRAVAWQPDDANGLNLLGMALNDQHRWGDAVPLLRRALRIGPDFADAHNNMGNALLNLDRFAEAIVSYGNAILYDPRAGIAWGNRGSAFQRRNEVAEAQRLYRRAVLAEPKYTRANFHLGMALLLDGELKEGWEFYEWRATIMESDKRPVPGPLWAGEPLAGKRILLHTEQGLGDTVQMLRYVPLLAERGATVVLELPAPLMRLATTLPGSPELVELGRASPPYHVRSPLMSLPYRCGTDSLEKIPANVPYLSAPDDTARRWTNALGRVGRPTVGLVWTGNPAHGNDRARSVPVKHIRALVDGAPEEVEFVLVQKDPRAGEDDRLLETGRCRSLGPLLGDFADTAGLLAALDLLITVDTSVAHLAGAMGRPVWMMVPFSPDFRWLLGRDDSPWYPTLRLYRQPAIGDWTGVVARIGDDLRRWSPVAPA